MISIAVEQADLELDRFRAYRDNPSRLARNELATSYGSLATALARRFARRGEDTDDLEQVAQYALLRAIERFDVDRGLPFVGFAVPTIVGEIKRHFRDRTWGTRVPRTIKDLIPMVNGATDDLCRELQRAPTAAEVADRTGKTLDRILEVMEARRAYRPASLNALTDGRTPYPDGESPTGDRAATDSLDRMTVKALLSRLPARERCIVEMRFYGELTQRDIAEQMGMSQMHVSRLLRKALTALAAAPESK